jgi:hypothetical protein
VGTAYAKVFQSLFDGSLRGRSDEILVFVNLLTHATAQGVSDIHFKKISDETGLSMDAVKKAISCLESPDPDSRTPDDQGRRIKRIDDHRDWGWYIVNHWKYRMLGGQDERTKELTRKRVQEFRAKKSNSEALRNVTVTSPAASASASASVPDLERGTGKTIEPVEPPESPPEIPTELPHGFPPSVDDAIVHAAFVGCDTLFATATWNKAMGRGGRDSREVVIRSWRHHLATEWSYEQARRNKEKMKAANGQVNGSLPLWQQLKILEQEISQHRANKDFVGYNARSVTDLDRDDLRRKREKLKKLKTEGVSGV